MASPLLREGISAAYPFPTAGAVLHIDPSGTRWSIPEPVKAPSASAPAPPVPVAAGVVDLEPIEHRFLDEGELLMITRQRRLLKLTSPLVMPVPAIAAELPEGTVASTVRRFHGALTVRAKRGLFWSSDGRAFVSVPGLADHAPGEAILDAEGAGIGLFFPERVAFTRDAGKSWTTIALPDAHVTRLDHRGDQLVALPGGIRDAFARAIDPRTGAIERSLPSLTAGGGHLAEDQLDLGTLLRLGPRGFRRRFPAEQEGSPAQAPPPRYVPGEAPRGFHLGPAIDGDNVLAFQEEQDEHGRRTTRASTGLLGESLRPFAEGALSSCNVRASALCGVRAAVVCDREIVHLLRGTEIGRTAVAHDTVVAFDQEGRLWTASPDRERNDGTVLLRRFPIDGLLPSPGEEHARVLGGTPRFVGGCRAPALWAMGEMAAAKLHGTGFADVLPLPKDTFAVGVAATGALVRSTGGELVFLPGDRRVTVKAHLAHHVSFSEDGWHALLATPSGQLEQSDDAGKSFAPVATPPVLARQAIVCGRERCQLGPSALREGFGRDPRDVVAAWPEPPREDGSLALHRHVGDGDRVKVPATDHFVCERDATLFGDATRGSFAVRTGAWLFASVSASEDEDPHGYFGAPDGSGQRAPLPSALTRAVRSGVPVSFAGGVGRVSLLPDANEYDPRGGRAAVRWEPAQEGRTVVGRYPDVNVREDIWTEAGIANVFTDAAAGELWWVDANRDARRAIAVSRIPSFGRQGGHLGMLRAARDDVWYGAFSAPPNAALGEVPTLTLLTARAEGPSEDRRLSVGRTSAVEVAVGLAEQGVRVALVALEQVAGTEDVELRLRALSDDLQLGEARALVGTRGPADRLLELPPCTARGEGALVRLDALTPRRVRIGDRQAVGYLVRLARVDGDAACLERSYVVETRDTFRPIVVVAGNEGIGFANEGGVRCRRAPSTP